MKASKLHHDELIHLICERDVGLFSLIQQVLAQIPWAMSEQWIPVVFFGSRCCYWTPRGYHGKKNVWEYYFEPLAATNPEDSISLDTRDALQRNFPEDHEIGCWINSQTWASCHFGDHPELQSLTISIPYEWNDPDWNLRDQTSRIGKRHIRPRDYIVEKVNAFYGNWMKGRDVVGVHIRGTDAISRRERRPHRRGSLVLRNYAIAIDKQIDRIPEAKVFVATDDQRSLEFIKRQFGSRIIAYDSIRHQSGKTHGRGPTGCLMPNYIAGDRDRAALNGEQAVIEYLLLTRCCHLIHNGSSLARTVLLANADLPHTNTHRPIKWLARARTLGIRKFKRHLFPAIHQPS